MDGGAVPGAARDAPGGDDARRLAGTLAASPLVWEVLGVLQGFESESLWLGAGAVCQTVWNAAHGFEHAHGITDLDLVYFDPDLTRDDEARVVAQVNGLVGHLGAWADVKNQATVHTWYPARFGAAVAPYSSLDDAIATWPTTATAVGVRRVGDGLVVKAPFGLTDLLGLVVRPNRVQAPRWWYEQKCARWRALWPQLTILGWADGVGHEGARLITA